MIATETFLPATGVPILAYIGVAGITTIAGGIARGLSKFRGRRR